jgi:group I intron endonuclease
MICGIYMIKNTLNNKVYIGSSNDIKDRVKHHFTALKFNKHQNKKLQRSYNKHGKENFISKTLIVCDQSNKYVYEQLCIDFYSAVKHGFNINKKAERGYSREIEKIDDSYFAKRTIKNDNGCWVCTNSPGGNGVGKVKINKKQVGLHRVSYKYYVGQIPDKAFIFRSCGNKLCCNPDHLKVGNTSDVRKTWFANGGVHPRGNTALTEEQVREIKMSKDRSAYRLCKKYNVAEGTIRFILSGDTWKHVKVIDQELDVSSLEPYVVTPRNPRVIWA